MERDVLPSESQMTDVFVLVFDHRAREENSICIDDVSVSGGKMDEGRGPTQ